MFDVEELGVLLDDVGENSPSVSFIDLDLDNDGLNENNDVLFISAFAYALSRFAGSDRYYLTLLMKIPIPSL